MKEHLLEDIDTVVCFRVISDDIDPVWDNLAAIEGNTFHGVNSNQQGRYTLNSEMSFYLDMPEICKRYNVKYKSIELRNDFQLHQEYSTTISKLGRVLYIIEPWVLYVGYITLLDLKLLDPECKIACVAWDDFYYLNNMFSHEFSIENIELADLYMTNEPRKVNMLRESLGVNAQFYISTPCKKMLEICEQRIVEDSKGSAEHIERSIEIGSFMTFRSGNTYRSRLKRYLNRTFDNTLLGASDTQHLANKNIMQTLSGYLSIKTHLGNTSSAWAGDEDMRKSEYWHRCGNPNCSRPRCNSSRITMPSFYQEHKLKTHLERCMKGVKDFLAPLMGSILIYDDFYLNKIFFKDVFPMYEYDDVETIKTVYDEVTKDEHTINNILSRQVGWIKKHSFFNQFIIILDNQAGCFEEELVNAQRI